MRGMPIIVVLLMPLQPGCNLAKLINYNMWNEPIHMMSERKVADKAVKLAEEAWAEHLGSIPDNCPPEAYQQGFVNGYADYLLHGGNTAPPAMPPAVYRRYQN